MTNRFDTHTDQFGQIVYECPTCGRGFLTTLADSSPTTAELEEALAFHSANEATTFMSNIRLAAIAAAVFIAILALITTGIWFAR